MKRISTMMILFCAAQPAAGVEQVFKPKPLDGTAIIAAFQGQTLQGTYSDGTPLRETYKQDGATDYWDIYRSETGNWSVINNLFCTFYETGEMNGACFRVEQISNNCYDFFAAANSTEEALRPDGKVNYTARASVQNKPDTCPQALSS
jgi:hypothetical protein